MDYGLMTKMKYVKVVLIILSTSQCIFYIIKSLIWIFTELNEENIISFKSLKTANYSINIYCH